MAKATHHCAQARDSAVWVPAFAGTTALLHHLRDRLAAGGGVGVAAEVARAQGTPGERALDRADDRLRRGLLAEMLQHHRARPDHADRVGDALPRDVGRRAVHRLEHRREIALRIDFAEIFEVKSKRVIRKGNIKTHWNPDRSELVTAYQHGDFDRSFLFRIKCNASPPVPANGRINFLVDLAPGGSWHACCEHEFIEPARVLRSPRQCCDQLQQWDNAVELSNWRKATTSVTTANEDIYRLFKQSLEDMAALRLPDQSEREYIPAAGVPWFVTVFGRDSLIVSLQNMIVFPDFARGALDILGQLQATEIDDYRDAQPGKIPHEIRYGELAELKRIPHTPYYGTADATALYLITLHEAWKWLGDDALFRKHERTARKCLEWIDRYGDLDGDGFQEYQTRSPQGYENMGWKDAGDSVVYPDGSRVKGPKALCELQGYTYDAWLRMADVFEYFRDTGVCHQIATERCRRLLRKREMCFSHEFGPGPLAR